MVTDARQAGTVTQPAPVSSTAPEQFPATAQVWRQWPGNPVFRATLRWEEGAVDEPTIMWRDNHYEMWYTGGTGANCSLGYAESNDGIHWHKYGRPILRDACHNEVAKTPWGYDIYTVDANGDLDFSTSRDGIHIVRHGVAMKPTGVKAISNSYEWHDRAGWHLLYEALMPDFEWQIGLAGGTRGHWTKTHPLPIGLPTGSANTFGGPWLDGHCLYFHGTRANILPTDIYVRCTRDFAHWGPPRLAVSRSQPWEVDQVADPSIARAPGRKALMAFSGMNNSVKPLFGAIGIAWLQP
jgi:hypothetical protein